MTLRQKTLVIIGVALLGLLVAMYATSRVILLRGLAEAEEHAAAENMERVLGAFSQTLADFETPAADWSKWDDTYNFAQDHNQRFLDVNLTDESLATLKLNLLLVVNTSGRIVFGTGFDLEEKSKVPPPEGLRAHLTRRGLLRPPPGPDRGVSGLIMLPQGPMIVTARAILTSEGKGPSRGTLVFGRYLDGETIGRLAGLTRLALSVHRLGGPGVSGRLRQLRPALDGEGAVVVRPLSERQIGGYTLLRDIYGRPCLLLQAAMPRSIYAEGQVTVGCLILTLLAGGVAFGLVLLVLLEKGVLSRLRHLISAVGDIGSRGDPSRRVSVRGSDELASLAASVNDMLASLERSQESLKSSEERFRSVAQTATDAIISADSQGNIIFWNKAAQEMFGYAASEVVGRPLTLILPERLRELHLSGLARMAAGGKGDKRGSPSLIGRSVELAGRRQDGSELPIEISLATWTTREGMFFTGIIRDVTERRQAEERLRYLSLHDSLTGLCSRAYFEQEMRRLEAGRLGSVALVLCDVDGLKLVNDTLGHDAGDSLLVAAAQVIAQSCRRGDVVARIGGDEFAVLLAAEGAVDVESVVTRLRTAVARYNAVSPEIPLSISAGFASAAGPCPRMGELFKEADNNMYREKLHRSQSARSAIVQTLMKALEARDFITEGHADRLKDLVARLGAAIGLPERSVADLRLLAQFHDIGKVGIPDRILFKPGPLSPEERAEMQRHSEIGYRIAQSAPDLAPIAEWILKHHESWDGRGYPLGLQGVEIPLECRILAIADSYDAMVSDRPYRKARSPEEAVAELERCAGTQFDPELVRRFGEVLEQGRGLPQPGSAERRNIEFDTSGSRP